ncbi:MAG TPA: nucleotide exchange factor GrpE [Firmicutes bacterium]|nr:nucleotide exchange factor GrpE [Bacillota bacterium]
MKKDDEKFGKAKRIPVNTDKNGQPEKSPGDNSSELKEGPCDPCPVPVDDGAEFVETEVTESPTDSGTVDELRTRLDEMTENWQRERAQFINYKRRIEEERKEIRKYACYDFAYDLLRVVDYFESSINFEKKLPEDAQSVIIGVKYTLDELKKVLAEYGVCPIEAEEGMMFDSTCMEAIERQVVPDVGPGTILKVQRKGWRLHDRVLRSSMVVVAVEAETQEQNLEDTEVN